MVRIVVALFFVVVSLPVTAVVGLTAIVIDKNDSEGLVAATVIIAGKEYKTDIDGRADISVEPGRYVVTAKYVGMVSQSKDIDLVSDTTVVFAMGSDSRQLGEVVVTARDMNTLTTASRIDRDAMSHLQPTSFADLLELLPGGISKTPDMSRTNSIGLRETGNIGASGAVADNPDYAITSLGTSFVVDGAPISTDGALTSVAGASSGDAAYQRAGVNRGVDMRTLSTDNIESVEIVRGIPSAEYGNLTSGMVNVRRIRRATPWTARFKADEYSKLLSVGKGMAFGSTGENTLNGDLSWLDSKADPRNNLENYKRLTASLRLGLRNRLGRATATWNISADYTGSFDNVKSDPDLTQRKVDEYRSSYNRYAIGSQLALTFRSMWVESLTVNASASLVNDRVTRSRQVTANGTPLAPTSMSAGESEGRYLLGTYLADYDCYGKPVDIFVKARMAGSVSSGVVVNAYKGGAEWTMSKNYGRGQVYDLERPLSGGWTTRPRSFNSIPALHTVSAFVEDEVTVMAGNHQMEARAGLRMVMLPNLDSRYYLSRRPYCDPRFNILWHIPSVEMGGLPLSFTLGGGIGVTTKMPTIDYLFPQVHYADFVQLGYFDINNPAELSRVNLLTYVTDPTNYQLRPARNLKWELRLGAGWGKNQLNVTFFREKMSSGFRYSSVYDRYSFRKYDASAIDPSTLTSPPSLEGLPYTAMFILDGHNRVTNGTRIDKDGVELQLSTARWQPLRTALTVTGAWFRSRYSNSQPVYYPISAVVGQTAVSDRYVGIYDTNDGRINHQLSSNFMFDTQISNLGLIFTTTLQCVWFIRTRRLAENGIPTGYLSADDGRIHPWTANNAVDPVLQHLVRRFSDQLFETQTIPTALYLNLKATKQIGRWLRISAYVNRIIDYLPDYTSNGLTIRRSSEAYFGMEATLTF